MATQNSTQATPGTSTPVRRLVAAGIKRGPQPWLVEQPTMTQADIDAHQAATHVRSPQPSAA
jgi:hypothetical protein